MAVAFVKNHTVASNKVSSTTLAVPLDTDVPAGNLIVLRVLFDNAAVASTPTVFDVGIPVGEGNWTTGPAINSTSTSAGAFASGAMWYIRTGMLWPAGTYTVTLSAAVTQKAGFFQEFSGVLVTGRGTAGTAYSTTTTAASATTATAVGEIGDLTLGFIFGSNVAAAQAGDTDTTGGSWSTPVGVGSTGGSGTTNNFGVGQYKILTATGFQTVNNSALMTAGNGALVRTLRAEVPALITQAAYRFYADGTETGATALGTQDTSYTADLSSGDLNLAVRVRLQSTNAGDLLPLDDYQLQYAKNGGTWTDVTSGVNVAGYASANLTDGAVTTNRLTGGTGSFVAGKVSEDGLVDNRGWTANNYTELLYAITLKSADLADADTINFRVLRNSATTGMTYTQTPALTISEVSGQNITTTGITTSLAFGTMSVAAGAVNRTTTGIGSTLTFGTATVAAGAVNITLTGITSTLAFGTAAVTTPAGTQGITTSSITSPPAFGSPAVTAGEVARTTSGISSTLTFGTVSLAAGTRDLALTGVATSLTFGVLLVGTPAETQTIIVTGIVTTLTFGTTAVGAHAVSHIRWTISTALAGKWTTGAAQQ